MTDATAGGQHRNGLGNAEETERDNGQGKAVEEVDLSEGEAEIGGGLRGADDPEKDAETGSCQPFGQILPDHRRGEKEANQREHEQFWRREHEDDGPGDWDRYQEDCRPHETPHHRGEKADAKCACRVPLLGQGVPLDRSRCRRRRAGCTQKDGRDRV